MIAYRIWTIARILVLELYRRKDFYVALILGCLIVVPLASVNLFGVKGIVRHLREVTLLLIWGTSVAIAVSTAARQLPNELTNRTIHTLLSRPIRREEVVLGKFFGSLLATGSCVVLLYALYALMSVLKAGAENHFAPNLLQNVLLHLTFCALLTALTVLGSTLMTPSANVTCTAIITIAMLLFGADILRYADRSAPVAAVVLRAVHFVAPHFEFFDLRTRLVHEWEPLSVGVLVLPLLYGIVYSAALLFAACLRFRRKAL